MYDFEKVTFRHYDTKNKHLVRANCGHIEEQIYENEEQWTICVVNCQSSRKWARIFDSYFIIRQVEYPYPIVIWWQILTFLCC